MDLYKLIQKERVQNIIIMMVLGLSSGVFSEITFNVPGVEGIDFDLREIPLLISIFYFVNPLYLCGVSLISSLFSQNIEYFSINFIIHCVALIIMMYTYSKIIRLNLSLTTKGIIWGTLIIFEYYVIIIILLSLIRALIKEHAFMALHEYMFAITKTAWIESFLTSFFVTVLFVLHIYRSDLKKQVEKRSVELSNALEKLQSTQKELILAAKISSLRTFTAGIAHEINNPLNFINGAIILLNGMKDNIKEENRENWQRMNDMLDSGYNRISKIVRDLTYFSHDTGYSSEKKDIHKIIEMALMMIKAKMPKDIKLMTKYKLKSLVCIHTEKIHSVIVNLMINAIQAIEQSGVENKIIEIATKEVGKNAHISIYNTGDHIPPETINKIFDPFFTTKDPQGGTGLGLSICYTLINTHHNGNIIVENLPNGVQFTVILPLSRKKAIKQGTNKKH